MRPRTTLKTPFKIISKLAKEKNEDMLKQLVNEGLVIGVFEEAFNNVMLLAEEGDFISTEFLINKFDANINHVLFGAAKACHLSVIKKSIDQGWRHLNYAVKGAGCCGNLDLINELLDRGASIHDAIEGAAYGRHVDLVFALAKRGAFLDYATRGAACAGNEDLMNELLIRGGGLCFAAEGAARGRFTAFTDKLIERASSRGTAERYKVIESLVYGNAFGGDVDYARSLIAMIDQVTTGILGAARGGHFELLKGLLDLVPEGNKISILLKAICEAAKEGHSTLVQHLIVDYNMIEFSAYNYAALGAAFGADIKLLNQSIENGADLIWAARGAARGCQIEVLNNIMRSGAVSLNRIVNEIALMGYLNTNDALRLISFIDDAELRRLLVIEAKNQHNVINEQLAAKINLLMRENHLTFYQAQGYLRLGEDSGFLWLLLQGHKYMCQMQLPFELYLKLIDVMIGQLDKVLNAEDLDNIYHAAHERLRDRVIKDSTTGFFNLFKSEAKLSQIKQTANARYKEKRKYCI